MANKNTSKTRRRPSKAELERKEAIQRMLISLGIAILLIFAAFKLGAAGITLYNLIRLLVGSLAYLAIFALLVYLFFFKWIRKQEGLLSGFFTIFAGLLLIFEAYLVWKYGLDKTVLKGTMAQVVTDLTGFRTTSFAGGGLDWCCPLCANSLSLFKYRDLLYWFYLDFSRSPPSQSLVCLRYC